MSGSLVIPRGASVWQFTTKLVYQLKDALDNGEPSLLFTDVSCRLLGVKKPTDEDIEFTCAILKRARRRLQREHGLVTILVTQHLFDYGEPESAHDARMCVAMGGRPASGIRVASMKGTKDDLLFIASQQFYANVGRGFIRECNDRAAIEHHKGRLTAAAAKVMLKAISSTDDPHHLKHYKRMLKAINETH